MSALTSLPGSTGQASQRGLFDVAPLASNADPLSSHIAADEITRSGARGHQKRELLLFLRGQREALTSYEIARAAGFDRTATARRLPDCADDGLVHRCPMRTCHITGRPAITWRIGAGGSTSATPAKLPRPDVTLTCRCGESFQAPAVVVERLAGSHCPSCRRFVQVAI